MAQRIHAIGKSAGTIARHWGVSRATVYGVLAVVEAVADDEVAPVRWLVWTTYTLALAFWHGCASSAPAEPVA